LFTQLRNLLPDAEDAKHAFQASKNRAGHLITVDRRTFVKHAAEIERHCGVKVVTPVEYVHAAVK
jgi:predicted nucleic acid-binding protein